MVAAPYDGPSLSIDFNTNCAHLTIQDPTQPNGIITEYQVNQQLVIESCMETE